MSEAVSIDAVRPEESAEWFGARMAELLRPEASVRALTLAWLHHQWQQGHTCLDFDRTVLGTSRRERARAERSEQDRARASVPEAWLAELQDCPAIARAATGSLDPLDALLVLEDRKLFLAACRHDEILVAQALRRMAAEPSRWHGRVDLQAVRQGLTQFVDSADPFQQQAVCLPFGRRLAVITGGPGTGKTSVTGAILHAALQAEPSLTVRVLASTGKAAARITQSLRAAGARAGLQATSRRFLQGAEASTIHRALLLGGGRALAAAGLVVVDECSMIDLVTMRQLLAALHPQASLVLLGDPDQLASVEAGSLLADLVPQSEDHALAPACVRLERSHRFSEGSALAELAACARRSDADGVIAALEAGGPQGLVWKRASSARELLQACEGLERAMPTGRLLCGHRRGPDGAVAVNRHITQARLGGAALDEDPRAARDYDGRPIMITVNDPMSGLHNGDTGVVRREGGRLVAHFADLGITVPVGALPARETAYAMTVHKSQGSEFDEVAIVLPLRPSPVLTRELLYTGITRSRGPVTVVASEQAIRVAVGQRIDRASGLRARIERTPLRVRP